MCTIYCSITSVTTCLVYKQLDHIHYWTLEVTFYFKAVRILPCGTHNVVCHPNPMSLFHDSIYKSDLDS